MCSPAEAVPFLDFHSHLFSLGVILRELAPAAIQSTYLRSIDQTSIRRDRGGHVRRIRVVTNGDADLALAAHAAATEEQTLRDEDGIGQS
jgi:hypothetical protein